MVADAAVRVTNTDGKQVHSVQTNKEGTADASFSYWGPGQHYEVQISKSGYLPYDQVLFSDSPFSPRQTNLIDGIPDRVQVRASQSSPLKIVLLKPPVTPAERQAFAVEEQKRQLLLAVKRSDTAVLSKLLQAGVKADTADAKGVPAIAWAAFVGDPETIKLLLAAGARVRNKNTLGHQALLIYLAEGIPRGRNTGSRTERERVLLHEEIMGRLIAAGAGINVKDPYRGTVLNSAINLIDHLLPIETLKTLIAAKANVNAADEGGQTPLMLAAKSRVRELAPLLLNAGARASINAKDKAGRSALINAAESYPDLVQLLIPAGANVNEADEAGGTALMWAARGSFIGTVQILLKAGAVASVNAKDKQGQTALIHAVIGYGQSPRTATVWLVKQLLAAGAKINEVDAIGRSALMYAATDPNDATLEVVTTLIAAGAVVNKVDAGGQTALMIAAQTNSIKILQTFLQAGAGAVVNAKDVKGQTALLLAVSRYSGAVETAKALLAAGANVNAANDEGQTPLIVATQNDSVPLVKLLLAAGAATDAKDKQGRTAAMHAAYGYRNSSLEIAKLLVEAKANLGEIDQDGETPLITAASRQYNINMVQALLETDARTTINVKDRIGRTALMYAAYYDPEIVQALVAAGANVNETDGDGQTALMFAADSSADPRLEIMRVLIGAGANVNAADVRGRTPLLHMNDYLEPVPSLFRALIRAGANVNAADKVGLTPLMLVAKWNSAEVIQLVLKAGASISAKDKAGKTALLYATSEGYDVAPAVIKTLVAAGANVNDVDESGQTPLMYAAGRASLETVKTLLEAGAVIDAKDKKGQTPLKLAVVGYDNPRLRATREAASDVVSVLIAAKANVNDVDENGQTPLMLAAKTGYLRTVQALLAAGAAVDAQDYLGQTALMYGTAEYFSSPEVAKALLAAGANVNTVNKSGETSLMLAAPRPSIKTIQTLLEGGAKASINAKDEDGLTALMHATWGDRDSRPEIIQALLAAGAQVNTTGKAGQTPLMLAAERDSLEMIHLLLAAGAKTSINGQDKKGWTPLMHALDGREDFLVERIKLLLASGADVSIKNNQGETALMIARKAGRQIIIKLLEGALPHGKITGSSLSAPIFRIPNQIHRTRFIYPKAHYPGRQLIRQQNPHTLNNLFKVLFFGGRIGRTSVMAYQRDEARIVMLYRKQNLAHYLSDDARVGFVHY